MVYEHSTQCKVLLSTKYARNNTLKEMIKFTKPNLKGSLLSNYFYEDIYILSINYMLYIFLNHNYIPSNF